MQQHQKTITVTSESISTKVNTRQTAAGMTIGNNGMSPYTFVQGSGGKSIGFTEDQTNYEHRGNGGAMNIANGQTKNPQSSYISEHENSATLRDIGMVDAGPMPNIGRGAPFRDQAKTMVNNHDDNENMDIYGGNQGIDPNNEDDADSK